MVVVVVVLLLLLLLLRLVLLLLLLLLLLVLLTLHLLIIFIINISTITMEAGRIPILPNSSGAGDGRGAHEAGEKARDSADVCVPLATFRQEPVRFDSFRFRTFRQIIGSVRFGSVRRQYSSGSTRLGLRFSDASWLGPVRFGRFGLVSYSLLLHGHVPQTGSGFYSRERSRMLLFLGCLISRLAPCLPPCLMPCRWV